MGAEETQIEASFGEAIRIEKEQKSVSLAKHARGIPSPKSERVGRTRVSTTSLLTSDAPIGEDRLALMQPLWTRGKRLDKLAKDNPLLRQLKAAVEYGQVMPNIPQMGRFFSSVSGALQIATEGRASAKAALQEAEASILHE